MDGRKEWICKFCSESNVWTRWRCRRCYNDIQAGLRGKYKQAVAARIGEWSTGSSTSSGEEDGKSKRVEAENKELEALEMKGGGLQHIFDVSLPALVPRTCYLHVQSLI